MKDKDIQKIIKDDFKSMTPDVISKIHLDDITVIEPKKKQLNWSFKRLAFLPVMTMVIILGVILLNNNPPSPTPTPNPRPLAFAQKEEVYSISAVSAASLLSQSLDQVSSNLSSPLMKLLSNPSIMEEDYEDEDEEDYEDEEDIEDEDEEENESGNLLITSEIDNLFASIHMIEPIIGNRDSMQFISTESELPEYDNKLIFSSLDLNNNQVEYIMYYNETVLSDEESTITGLLYISGIQYEISGEFNLDDEEQEIELIAKLPNDEDTYVVISQEIESDEESYEIEWVVNGETVLESSFEIEYEGEDIEVELSYESQTFEITYIIEKISPSRIQIEYEMENTESDEEGIILLEIFTVNNERVFRFTINVEDVPAVIIEKNESQITTNSL